MSVRVLIGNARARLAELPDESVHCCVTSPPYFGLRDYGVDGQIGLEGTPDAYVAELVAVFREVRRVLRKDGTLWLNLGDSYNGYMANQRGTGLEVKRQESRRYIEPGAGLRTKELKNKDLIGIPWLLAFALRADGWYLRSDIIWAKPNPMPESVTDRPTSAHEHVFLLSKSARYFYDAEAVREPGEMRPQQRFTDGRGPKSSGYAAHRQPTGMTEATHRNLRNVWTIATAPYPDAHFATFPPALVEPCIKAGCPKGGSVLDPFGGAGTTGLVADRLGRAAVLIEINPEYAEMARRRIEGDAPLLARADLVP